MASPIIELQQRVLDHEIHVSTLVRFALLLAKRANDDGMVKWCTNELNGYKKTPKDLEYRVVYGEYMATDRWGRDVPVNVRNPKMLDLVTKVLIWTSVGELEAMLATADKDTAWKMYLPAELEATTKEGMSRDVTRLFRLVQRQQLAQILEAVRSRLFDWTIQLQSDGVVIEDKEFPTLPPRKGGVIEASRTIKAEHYVEVREASQSPVQVGTNNSSQQTSYPGVDLEQVRALVAAVENDVLQKLGFTTQRHRN
jgi:hypothetical protein